MSVREILEELPRLDASERQTVLRRLLEIDPALEAEETPEMLAAIGEAVRSFDADKVLALKRRDAASLNGLQSNSPAAGAGRS